MKSLIPPTDLHVPGIGAVTAGVPVNVPDELVGHTGDPRRDAASAELAAAIADGHSEIEAALRAEIDTLDPGAGLLAQGWTRKRGKTNPASPDADNEANPATDTIKES